MRVRRLHNDLGAEVLDFDPSISGAVVLDELRQLLDEYQLLLFRPGRRIAPERQVEICGWFGTPTDDAGDGKRWSVLHNEDIAGRIRLPFHSDLTYTDTPMKIISLHAIELPGVGSSTSFVSGAHAWSTLPADRQELLAAKTVRHSHASVVSDDWPVFSADQPVRFVHPRTGRPVLFVTEHHAERILELDQEESDRVLGELFAHLYAPEHVYVHRWQLHDLVIWDNLAVQHARVAEADLADGARALQRVVTNELTYSEIIDRAREQQPRAVHHG